MERVNEIRTVTPEIIFEHADDIKALWECEEIQATFMRRNLFQIEECAKYFLSRVHMVMEHDYVPSVQDIVQVRERTTGIIQHIFTMKDPNSFASKNKEKKLILVSII